jgi:hypothetical protein
MKHTRTELAAALLTEAKQVIDELLDWREETAEPDLTQIEDMVLKLRQQLGRRMTELVIEDQEAVRPVPGPACPECGQEMRYKDMKGTTIGTRSGKVALERAYYYCEECRSGLFPPGSTTGSEDSALE